MKKEVSVVRYLSASCSLITINYLMVVNSTYHAREPVLNPLQRPSPGGPEVTDTTPIKNLEHREARLQVAQQVVGRIRTQTQAAENSKLLFFTPVVKFCD